MVKKKITKKQQKAIDKFTETYRESEDACRQRAGEAVVAYYSSKSCLIQNEH